MRLKFVCRNVSEEKNEGQQSCNMWKYMNMKQAGAENKPGANMIFLNMAI